jgi:hypothetical protein
VTFPLGTLASGTSTSCEFQVAVNSSASYALMSDDVENGAGLWTVSRGAGNDDWALNTDAPRSPTTAWFAADIATSTDQYLTLSNPVAISDTSVLRFWHSYDTEAAWDGGVVEISVNGGAWTDLGNDMFQNGYQLCRRLEYGADSVSHGDRWPGRRCRLVYRRCRDSRRRAVVQPDLRVSCRR